MNHSCPRCNGILTERTFGHETLDGCTCCGGLWFDYQELNALTRDPATGLMEVERAFQPDLSAEHGDGAMLCPKCSVALYGFCFPHTPNVPLNACPKCKGIWLDEGELQAIAERLAAARPQPAPSPSAEEKQREQARHACAFLLSVVCPACKVTNAAASLVCWQCGAPLKTRSVFHLCPRCDRPLEEFQAASAPVRVDSCRACSGLWFAAGELTAFLRLGGEEVRRVQQTVGVGHAPAAGGLQMARCPGCHHGMERDRLGSDSTIEIDHCPYCNGVWLDTGELVRAAEFVQRGGELRLGSSQSDPWGE